MNLRDLLQRLVEGHEFIGHPALIERVVLKRGVEGTSEGEPKDYKMGAIKQCFFNAAHLAIHERLPYVEGYVLPNFDIPFPIHHAWNLGENGRVIDNTLRKQEGAQYIGVVIDRAVLCRELVKNKVYGLFDLGTHYNLDFLRELEPEVFEQAMKVRPQLGEIINMERSEA